MKMMKSKATFWLGCGGAYVLERSSETSTARQDCIPSHIRRLASCRITGLDWWQALYAMKLVAHLSW